MVSDHRFCRFSLRQATNPKGLALGVLRCLAGTLETGFLAFLGPSIPGKETGRLERGTHGDVHKTQGSGDPVAHGVSLTAITAFFGSKPKRLNSLDMV